MICKSNHNNSTSSSPSKSASPRTSTAPSMNEASPSTPKDRKRSYKKRNHYNPTLEEIKATFHLPIDEAARKFDICPSKLKRLCRKLGIPRWPYTKKPRYSNEAKQVEMLLQQSTEQLVKLEDLPSTTTSPNSSQDSNASAPSSILSSLLAAASSQKMLSGLVSPTVGKTQKMTELLGNDGHVVFESPQRHGGYSVRNSSSSTSLANYAVAKALNYDPSLLLPNLIPQQTNTTETSSFTQQQTSSTYFEPIPHLDDSNQGTPYHEQSHSLYDYSSSPSISPEVLKFVVQYCGNSAASAPTPVPTPSTPYAGYLTNMMMQPPVTPMPNASFPSQQFYFHQEPTASVSTPESSFYSSAPIFVSPSSAPRHQAMTPIPNMVMDALAAALQHYQ